MNRLTNGWSFLHCLRSSARRGLQMPDIVCCVVGVGIEGLISSPNMEDLLYGRGL